MTLRIANTEKNTIKIAQNCIFRNTALNITNNSSFVIIDENCVFYNMNLDINAGVIQQLEIGKNTTFFGGRIVLRDNSQIKIGENCLFAAGLSMWATDGHTIFDLTTKEVLNKTPEQLTIGNHCWIGGDVHILKNGCLADETVVGISSVVTKAFTQTNTVIGGFPAKVLKTNIGWSRDTILNYEKREKRGKQPTL